MLEPEFSEIEKKWQDKWEKEKCFEVKENSKKRKFYMLEMFPYPSASGLHMGHAWNYTIGDIFARFKIMQGFNVLHPMGYDSLGLPAENAAIKEKKHPEEYTNNSIKNYIKQQKNLGLTYDWNRMINTANPDYYRWDQWIFLKMFEKGLVYQKEAPVNWCPKCNTILANEQVVNGKCWRHEDTDVKLIQMKQWFLKITKYADRLLEGHKKLKWPEKTIAMQKNWIGKSYGTEIDFEINNPDNKISNVIIIHGSPSKNEKSMDEKTRTYDKHWIPWLKKKLTTKGIKTITPIMPKPWEPNYNDWKKEFEKIEVNENSILIGHSAGGGFLVRWLGDTNKKIKKLILVAPAIIHSGEWKVLENLLKYDINDNVKNNVGEIVIFVSDNESKGIVKSVQIFNKFLLGKIIELKNKGHFTKGDMGTEEFPEILEEIKSKNIIPIFTTRPDTIFGVTFMVISAQHPKLFDFVTDKQKKEVENFLKKLKSVSEKDLAEMEKQGVFTGTYAINPANNEKIPIYAGNFVVADYASGMVMAVPAHDQRDFEFAKKYKIKIKQVIDGYSIIENAYTEQGTLINSKPFNGLNNEKAKKEISDWLIKQGKARKKINYKLRDWSIARQRYWGTPIPLIHCEKCGIVPVPENALPVELPKEVKFGHGNPLLTNEKWLNVKCPKCNGKAKREANTMDTFANSSWYFLRYCDSNNEKEIFSKAKAKYWMPVDLYIGGAEHACMHLIYSRFYTMFLHDLKLIDFDEPFPRLFHQGMLMGEDGEKMSKSKGNVILPEIISEKYGIDTARFFLCSLASPDKNIDWDENGIQGSLRFIKKIYSMVENVKIGKDSEKLLLKINIAIKNITNQIEALDYRKSTIELRELFDLILTEQECSKKTLENCLKLLAPFCPHVCEELWEKLDNKNFISLSDFPKPEKISIKTTEIQEDINKKTIHHIKELLSKIDSVKIKKIYVYAIPSEISKISTKIIAKETGKEIIAFATNNGKKYDPENRYKKALPGKPAIYAE